MRIQSFETPTVKSRPLLQDVLHYENNAVVSRFMRKLNLDEAAASLLFTDTKQFLYLCATIPGHWIPSERIDAAWHEFILFTREYAEFCSKYFDKFLHHAPAPSTESGLYFSDVHATLIAASELFGNLSPNWAPDGLSVDEALNRHDLVLAGGCGPGHPGCAG